MCINEKKRGRENDLEVWLHINRKVSILKEKGKFIGIMIFKNEWQWKRLSSFKAHSEHTALRTAVCLCLVRPVTISLKVLIIHVFSSTSTATAPGYDHTSGLQQQCLLLIVTGPVAFLTPYPGPPPPSAFLPPCCFQTWKHFMGLQQHTRPTII